MPAHTNSKVLDIKPPEEELFDPFFDDIQCLNMMNQFSAYALGDRILQVLHKDLVLDIKDLTFFMRSSSLKEHGMKVWHAYLGAQGYSIDVKENGENLIKQKVSREI